jgi:hypothetical protein
MKPIITFGGRIILMVVKQVGWIFMLPGVVTKPPRLPFGQELKTWLMEGLVIRETP